MNTVGVIPICSLRQAKERLHNDPTRLSTYAIIFMTHVKKTYTLIYRKITLLPGKT